jgi:hypothetical protein
MKLEEWNESDFGDPVDRKLGAVGAHVRDERQRMHDVAERGWADDQDRARRRTSDGAHEVVAKSRFTKEISGESP